MRRLGVLGGTFDPIHFGHLDAAAAARSAMALDEILFVPSYVPPHRSIQPHATAFHRFALVALAVNDYAGYRVADLELVREGRSYTRDTLRDLRTAGWSPSQLFFILGADAFAEIASWRDFPGVLDAAHFVVIARPGASLDEALGSAPELWRRVRAPGGADPVPAVTAIFPVPAHTRDISSTIVRARIAAQQSIDDLVPPQVVRHIAANHLYTAESWEGDLHGSNEESQDA